MRDSLKFCALASLQVPYNLLRRDIEKELFPFCQKEGLRVIICAPLSHGLLTGKFTKETTFREDDWRSGSEGFKGEAFGRGLNIVKRLKPLAEARGKTVGQLAIAWTLHHPAVTAALVGAKRPSQIEEDIGGRGWRLTAKELAQIEEVHPSGGRLSQ